MTAGWKILRRVDSWDFIFRFAQLLFFKA